MAKQVTARQQGDDYQARWFWLKACALLDDFSKVERVVYEDDTIKSLDDVVEYYRQGYTDELGMPLRAEFQQVKFHVKSAGALTAESLCQPAFIGASKHSLLQRIRDAYTSSPLNPQECLFSLVTPWMPDPNDHLAKIHSQVDGRLLLDALFQRGPRSAMGKMRALWREHLELRSEAELMPILARVRLRQGPLMTDLATQLYWRQKSVGLKPVPENSLVHTYDEITKKILANGLNEFTRQSMLEICSREDLLAFNKTRPANTVALGIRSFLRWAEDLQNQTQDLLCFSHHFDGRHIEDEEVWNTVISIRLVDFTKQYFIRGRSYRLHLDTHSSIAYMAGYLLPEKNGIAIDVVQHSSRGESIWKYDDKHGVSPSLFEFTQDETGHPGADEVALAIGLTHDIGADVMQYARKHLPSVNRVILALPADGPSSSSVRHGAHAEALANQTIQYLRANGAGLKENGRVHIFFAGPNGFMFCLGRKMQSFPCWTTYEHDFESGKPGAYSPSLTNPQ